ncbi:MAG: BON domain-containing protein [Alphaproteobacteria bacterium]|nr:BON domain-containing protein [Alphaproteobacteria bacterium]
MPNRLFLTLTASALLACGCASSRSLSASWEDMTANGAIDDRLDNDESFEFKDVDLTVFEGRVLLTGTVASAAEQRRLVEHALASDHVVQVIDETVISPRTTTAQGLTDARIDTTIRTRLTASGKVRASDVKIAVSNGSVYLLGVTRDRDSLEKMISTARTTPRVRQVVSHVIYMDATGEAL